MSIEVTETEFDFYMLPEFEEEAAAIWGVENIGSKLQEIADNLYKGDHIGGNIWKVRIAARGKGKRGGTRVIYALFFEDKAALLIEVYSKSKKSDLTKAEEKELAEFIKGLNIQGELGHVANKIGRAKAKVKKGRSIQSGKASTKRTQGKSKSAKRKKT